MTVHILFSLARHISTLVSAALRLRNKVVAMGGGGGEGRHSHVFCLL